MPTESVRVVARDTDVTPYDMGTLGSRSMFHMGHAVRLAAEEARDKIAALRREVGEPEGSNTPVSGLTNVSPSSIRRARRRARSSSTPIRAAWRRPTICSMPTARLCLRSGVGVRRYRRAQPHARRRCGARHHRNLHRSHYRAGRDARRHRHRRRQEEFAAIARRRPARSARRWADRQDRRRGLTRAVARQCRGR